MIRNTLACLVLSCCLAASGCKGTEDYLYDLGEVYDRGERRLRPEVYDAGQLVHEAFAGISDQQVLTISQTARAIALSGYVVAMSDREVVPLCQAQAVWTMARIAARYPVPPVSEPYEYTDRAEVEELVAAQITVLGEQQDRLGVPSQIALLNHPDHAVAERAVERLREVTGQDFGRNATGWEAWWTRNGPGLRSDAAHVSLGPMTIIGQARYTELTQAAAVLNFIGLHAAIFDMPEIRATQERTILKVARQVVVLAIIRGLRAGDSMVRGSAALAAAQVVDPAFGPALAYALPRERDGVARARIIQALTSYPGRESMLLLMSQLKDDDLTVTIHAHRALIAISGEDFGDDPAAWQLWWDQTGKTRWP
jgi:HEAT repeat protein